MSTEQEKIKELENKIAELNRIIALHNEDKCQAKIRTSNGKVSIEEVFLEAFSGDGNLYNKVVVSKHADSDFVNITFISSDYKISHIYMTEKSYLKFHEVIDIFKLKSINTRQFEEN